MSVYPRNVSELPSIELKLGIKSSFPNVLQAIALLYLIWKVGEKKQKFHYCIQDNSFIKPEPNLLKGLQEICAKNGYIIDDDSTSIIESNPLFTSQIEHLNVACELIWKLAHFDFADESKPFSAERSGGERFLKRVSFTANIDVIDSLVEMNERQSFNVLCSWLLKKSILEENKIVENSLIRVLTYFSEDAFYQIRNNDKNILFRNLEVYKEIVNGNDVNLRGEKDNNGPLRILCSSLKEGTHFYVTSQKDGDGVSAKLRDENLREEFKNYSSRVELYLLDSSKNIGEQERKESVVETKCENPNGFAFNRILFGAPGTGKSHKLEEDCETYFCDSNESLEKNLIEEIKNRPQDKDKEPWFNHIGMKYASFVYKIVNENAEEALQGRLGISQNELWKMKTAAKASIDYAHVINNGVEEIGKRYERVTFHPNYSYAQFVGTYKPVQNSEKGKESEILYSYVPGPFLRILVNALKHPEQDFLLIIEEINRANVAAVFGDVFQLLDRKDGVSEYPVAASEDIKRYLKDNGIDNCDELKIPSNMYIWATMNSADQGVFPMDTAFKRRWEFEYIGVDDNQQKIENFEIPMQEKKDDAGNPEKDAEGNVTHEWMKWNDLRTKINDKLTELGINEDKLLGPFFISLEKLQSVENRNESEAGNFVKAFKSKVLMYLFEDAVKMKAPSFFKCDKMRYSEICKKFDTDGIGVFNF